VTIEDAAALEQPEPEPEEVEEVEEEEEEEEEGLVGRRLQLIPHDVDARLVFRFEFGPAILAQVLEKIHDLPQLPLAGIKRGNAPYPGFYQLFRNGESVYVGRAMRPVGARLAEHARKLRGRIPLAEMTAHFLFVEDLSLVGLSEDAMIAYFHPLGLDAWGKMGFGSKATGYGRAGQQSEWHTANPPNLTLPIRAGNARPRTLRQLVRTIASGGPLVLSIPKALWNSFDEAHPDRFIEVPRDLPFDAWIAEIERRLSAEWRIQRQPMAWYIVRDES
jgi:hypothetical protein